LYAKDVDLRTVTFEKAMEMGSAWQRRTKALILRAAMLRNGNVHVKTPPQAREDATPAGSNLNLGNSSAINSK